MWDEHGDIMFVLTFQRGAVVSYDKFGKSKREKSLSCAYRGKLLKTRSRTCPRYEDIAVGFRTMPESDEPRVPVDADPRRD